MRAVRGLRRQERMARNEHQPQQVVVDAVVRDRVECVPCARIVHGAFASDLRGDRREAIAAAESIDRTALRNGHEPRSRFRWNALTRPPFERGNERVASEIFG